jgi:hypothetical protein
MTSKRWFLVAVVLFCADLALGNGGEYAPLPDPPDGFKVRQVATLPAPPTKLASDGTGRRLFVLVKSGDVYAIDLLDGQPRKVFDQKAFAPQGGEFFGMTLDRHNRLYLIGNRGPSESVPKMNHVTIFRTISTAPDGVPAEPKPWFETDVPWAIDVFQHGVSHIEQGPDGMIYVSSGSRTDHGESGNEPSLSKEGENEHTACIWRLDPKSDKPQIEVFARGLRNAFGFCFDDRGRMFATENGPNAHPAEEINLVERGKHYGFPYHFSDWKEKAYPDQPDAPPGFEQTLPILNLGPAGGGRDAKPLSTLDPHSSPSGIVYLGGDEWPPEHRGTFLVARFGNMVNLPKDIGFDLLQVRLIGEKDGRVRARVTPFLAPVARPTDLHKSGKGKIYVCEHHRTTRNGGPEEPGRILEISVADDEASSPRPD